MAAEKDSQTTVYYLYSESGNLNHYAKRSARREIFAQMKECGPKMYALYFEFQNLNYYTKRIAEK